ncbi:MAG TPA: hypothetical protein VL501_07845 [Pyrinomonadaceae bacterium]|nr:hypothetical protein [Pyrinomonadaceae bacterium]
MKIPIPIATGYLLAAAMLLPTASFGSGTATLNRGTTFAASSMLFGNGSSMADRTVLGDGILVSDGILISDGIIISDTAQGITKRVIAGGDDTQGMH